MSLGVLVTVVVFLAGIFFGLPLGWGFLTSTAAGLFTLDDALSFMSGAFYHSLDSYVLMGIGFFIFAGGLISDAGLADRIVRFSYAVVGRVKGGMIVVGLVATLIMSALTGSSLPCISALIPLLVPRLEKYGYKRVYTTAVLCSASFLGYLIPPSVPAMIYCLVAQQSIAAVFLSTVFHGLILALGYGILNYFICDRYMDPTVTVPPLAIGMTARLKELKTATWTALPALGAPIVILVGIYGGVFTPNEAGAVVVVYCLLVGFFAYRELNAKSLWNATMSTMISLGMIGLLIAGGTVFTRLLIREGAAQALAEGILGLFQSKTLILLSLNVFLLILGMFIDGIPILILAVPMILPLISQLDMNLVHLGSMIIVNVGLGVVTPPYAVSIFVGSRLSGVSYGELVKPMLLFLLIVGIPTLLLTTFIPALSCWLPTLLLGQQVVGPW